MRDKRKAVIPEQRELTLPPRTYQPSRAELLEEFDMPGMDMETVRKAFLRPVRIKTETRK